MIVVSDSSALPRMPAPARAPLLPERSDFLEGGEAPFRLLRL